MKIFVNTLTTGVGHQILDGWNSYRQFQTNYINLNHYTLTNGIQATVDKDQYNLTVLLDYSGALSVTEHLIKQYDIVLICNGSEPICVANPDVKKFLNYNNVFLISNSYLTDDCEIKNKVIWYCNAVMLCRDYWTRRFYPQYHDLSSCHKPNIRNPLIYINGANRSHRQYFIDCVSHAVPGLIIKNNINTEVCEIGESQWESSDDTEFRNWVNRQYQAVQYCQDNYYSKAITVGINNCFGKIPPGFIPMPLYYENSCVIFPESNWQNNELSITEKACKCFYAESLPMPVAGANVNQLYNEAGFYTAWNLLPDALKEFDSVLDHRLRYQKLSEAIAWLNQHPEIFDSELFHVMTRTNKVNFLTCRNDYFSIVKFDQILNGFIR